ncbi:MAG: NAD(P)-binding domain-containing protein [Labilithrix sp.]|nr:NAD(P)-binding domain-containing protein [Labilithrix sp.]
MEAVNQRRVAIIGGGAWGLALASAAARAESDVVLLSRRELNGALPRGVRVVREMREAAKHARLVVLAVPSSVARVVARELGDHLDGAHYVVHGVRGLVHDDDRSDPEDLRTISEVIREETPVRRTGALGGPALAQDILAGKPSVVVVGSRYPEVSEVTTAALSSPTLRIYPTTDLRGVEWASALVGCLTIAIGYAQAMNTSAGLVAALISRAVGEASRIAAAAGGEEKTLLGLAGYGDLLASIAQTERPEVLVGQALAKGLPPEEAAKAAELRVEALELIPFVTRWAEAAGVRAPIFRALAAGVVEGKKADAILHELMTLPIEHRA